MKNLKEIRIQNLNSALVRLEGILPKDILSQWKKTQEAATDLRFRIVEEAAKDGFEIDEVDNILKYMLRK